MAHEPRAAAPSPCPVCVALWARAFRLLLVCGAVSWLPLLPLPPVAKEIGFYTRDKAPPPPRSARASGGRPVGSGFCWKREVAASSEREGVWPDRA